jgi:hypothetical protein
LLFGITTFLSAFLLFQVQLIVGKYLLPWFGGTAAVWTTSLLFFQTLLFAGYCYAHWLVTRNPARRQAWIHAAVLLGSMTLLAWLGHEWRAPILAGESWRAAVSADPAWQVLCILLISAGVPFFVLAATGPLMQAWLHRLEPGRVPYRLYALSNLGSALGLLAYPFLEEPLLRLTRQAWLWAGGFLVFAIFCALAAWLTRRAPLSPSRPAANDGGPDAVPSVRLRASWLAIAACASLLMVATTSTICRDVAPLPLLWVAPLFLYLLTFVVCFQGETWYRRPVFAPLLVVATALACYALARDVRITGVQEIGIYCLALFAGCMVCHGELARLKPSPRHLTSFFLFLSAGGALGGLCAAIIAPRVFAGTWEYHVALWGSWAVLVFSAGSALQRPAPRRPVLRACGYFALLALAATLVATAVLRDRGTVEITRNFYGVLRVAWDRDYPNAHILELYDGNIVHGAQFADPESRNSPAFYGTESGVGVAILRHPRYAGGAAGRLRIGVVGLGAGAMAAFARPGDTVRFYEINPDVVRLARSHFTYLSDTAATVEVVPGDARISLEDELRRGSPQQFDVLALDAFHSDAVPMHLLTREAFRTYLQHMRGRESILAVNVTGFNLDLSPVVLRLANEFGMCASLHKYENSGGGGIFLTDWMLLTRDPQLAARLSSEGTQAAPRPGPLWTDETSNLLGVIRWRENNAGK